MKKVLALSAACFMLFTVIGVHAVFAWTQPDFPSCTNPTGNIIAQYSTGMHAIAGDPVMYSGADTVYQVEDNSATQCFCPDNGSLGIQTNWWYIEDLTGDQRNDLLSQGWYILEGENFGLHSGPYAAQNSNFSCESAETTLTPTEEVTPTPSETASESAELTETPTPMPTPTSAPASSESNSGSSSNNSSGSSSGSSGSSSSSSSSSGSPVREVAALAYTGSSSTILSYLVDGLALLSSGLFLRKKVQN